MEKKKQKKQFNAPHLPRSIMGQLPRWMVEHPGNDQSTQMRENQRIVDEWGARKRANSDIDEWELYWGSK